MISVKRRQKRRKRRKRRGLNWMPPPRSEPWAVAKRFRSLVN